MFKADPYKKIRPTKSFSVDMLEKLLFRGSRKKLYLKTLNSVLVLHFLSNVLGTKGWMK